MSNKRNLAGKAKRAAVAKADFATEQEAFWAGSFGDDYTQRNQGAQWIANNLALFGRILTRTDNISSLLELGANLGLNLRAIRQLLPEAELTAVEINARAVAELKRAGNILVHHTSIFDFKPAKVFDLILMKGVLIHLNPDRLPEVYDMMYAASARYICVAEYYNPTPVAIPYRGHSDRLFKRDFAGELLYRRNDLRLVDYGFVYHGDPNYPQDDLTWFLLEKTGTSRPGKK